MKNKLIKTVTILTMILFLESCVRTFSPYQAANKGGLKCNKSRLR